jgi:purine-nucleoside phosphorylase
VTVPTPHIAANAGDISDAILLPGDPLRAEFIAQTFLTDVTCYSRVRNMLGFTGTYEGRRVSVQGTGMGMPSITIYVTELMRFYGVKTAIRVGSAGGLQEKVKLRDVVIAMSAHTNSNMTSRYFDGIQFAPTANFELLRAAVDLAGKTDMAWHVGSIFTSDSFYDDNPDTFTLLAKHGALAVEMECAALYTIAAREQARALCIATVSDHLITHEMASTEERQTGFMAMAKLALDTIIATS